MSAPSAAVGAEVHWHDAECGAYRADLPVWERLAAAADGPVLELGAGTGRVALHLAGRGHEVCAVDRDPELLAALAARAARCGARIATVRAEVPAIGDLGSFGLVIAPMQFVQLLDAEGRAGLMRWLRAGLAPGARFAAALLDDRAPLVSGPAPAVPDVREVDGWIHSSLPLRLVVGADRIEVRRLRQLVSPRGELSEEKNVVRLAVLPPERLELEARAVGLRPAGRSVVEPSADHVGSAVVTLERQ